MRPYWSGAWLSRWTTMSHYFLKANEVILIYKLNEIIRNKKCFLKYYLLKIRFPYIVKCIQMSNLNILNKCVIIILTI